jgi:hypothetical protein
VVGEVVSSTLVVVLAAAALAAIEQIFLEKIVAEELLLSLFRIY